jgi:hypothetical protein
MPNNEPRKWHRYRTVLQPSYSITLHPKYKNLNQDVEGFLRHRFKSAYYAQAWSVQEPAFIKNPKKPCMVNIEKLHEKRTSKLFITNEKLLMCT